MPCPYFLDRLPEGAPSTQHLLPGFLHFLSPEEHQGPFGFTSHKQFSFFAGSVLPSMYLFSSNHLSQGAQGVFDRTVLHMAAKGKLNNEKLYLKPTS